VARSLVDTCRQMGALEEILEAVQRGGPLPVSHTSEVTSYGAELLDLRLTDLEKLDKAVARQNPIDGMLE
jgi:hypothetical protein